MPQCSAINCSNRPEKGFKLFRFPAEVKRRRKWVEYCGRKDFVPTNNSALCELHFSEDQFRTDQTQGVKKLNRDAIPSVHVQSRSRPPTSKGKKKCKFPSQAKNLLTEEPKKKEDGKLKAGNVDAVCPPVVKKTKRWTHLPKVDWSYDHLYSRRRRIYFEIVESCVLTGKLDGKHEDKVEGVTNEDAKFCKGVQSGRDWTIKELTDAIEDAVQAKAELQKQLMNLCKPKENAEHGGCGNMEDFSSDLQDDLQVLDLCMTVDEVNDGHVYDDVEMEARAELTKQLEELESLEKTLKIRLTKKLDEEKVSREDIHPKKLDEEKVSKEDIHPAVDEPCWTEAKVERGECTETEASGKVRRENPIVGDFDSGVEIADAQDAGSKSPQTSAVSAVENGPKELSAETSSSGFVCESCGKMFPSFYQMHSHQRLHINRKRRPRICSICHKSFLLLGRHLRTHSGERPYRCLHCGRQFSRLDNLQNHLRSHANRAGKRHACDQCGVEFPGQHEFRLHQRTHRGETLYSCAHCDRQFLYRNVWKSHVKSHLRRKQFLCNICGKQFVQANNLNNHIASVHSNERSHECRACGKRFVRASSLRLHMNAHTGNRPHPCDRCTKRFFTPGGLAAHTRIHYDETPFVCGVCWKCFRYSCHLKIHMRVHTGERPYQCAICSKCFAQNGNLKEHMRMHLQMSSTHEET